MKDSLQTSWSGAMVLAAIAAGIAVVAVAGTGAWVGRHDGGGGPRC